MDERQPSLTHVEEWNPNIKDYTKITIEEAVKKYSGTISAKERVFRCSLCGDYVSLTKEHINKRYFRHEPNTNRFCPDEAEENTVSCEQEYKKVWDSSRSLPLYLKENRKTMWFEIGFFHLNKQSFQTYQNTEIHILTEGKEHLLGTYRITPERFGGMPITHIQIGSVTSQKYILEYLPTEPNGIKSRPISAWGNEVCGIDPNGTMFDGKSGRRIPDGTCVEAGHTYWLLTKEQVSRCNNVHICKITRLEIPPKWYLYQIIANVACQDAADFFRDYRLFLTGSPEKFTLLWPVCTQYLSEHVILHTGKGLSLFHHGERTERMAIYLGMSKAEAEDAPGDQATKAQFVDLPNCTASCMPLVGIRRNKIFQYAYLLEDMLRTRAQKPGIHVLDQNGHTLIDEDYFSLPCGGKISVLALFNGFAEIWEDGLPMGRIEIKSEMETERFQVHYGWEIRFYQGLDCIRKISFQRKTSGDVLRSSPMRDAALLTRLKRYKGKMKFLPHSIGYIALKMGDYPQTKKWFLTAVRKQSIPEDALALLKSTFRE